MYTNSRVQGLPFRPQNGNHRNQQQETNTPQYKEYRKLITAAITEFQKYFNNQPILDVINLEDAIHQLNDQMLRNLNKVAPMKRRRSLKKSTKIMVQQGSPRPKENSKKQGVKVAQVQTTLVDSFQKRKKPIQSNNKNSTRDTAYSQK